MKTKIETKQTEKQASVEAGVVVKLGMDVHSMQITVVRQLGDQAPQPAQRFTKEALLVWVKRMVGGGAIVHSCYEAGVMGYTLHRELEVMGVKNLVVAPQKLAGARRQKTDALDAFALCERLDRYVRGNQGVQCCEGPHATAGAGEGQSALARAVKSAAPDGGG